MDVYPKRNMVFCSSTASLSNIEIGSHHPVVDDDA